MAYVRLIMEIYELALAEGIHDHDSFMQLWHEVRHVVVEETTAGGELLEWIAKAQVWQRIWGDARVFPQNPPLLPLGRLYGPPPAPPSPPPVPLSPPRSASPVSVAEQPFPAGSRFRSRARVQASAARPRARPQTAVPWYGDRNLIPPEYRREQRALERALRELEGPYRPYGARRHRGPLAFTKMWRVHNMNVEGLFNGHLDGIYSADVWQDGFDLELIFGDRDNSWSAILGAATWSFAGLEDSD